MNQFERYEKQILFKPCGLEGQKKLRKTRIGILGVGALGSNLAGMAARSGFGHITLVDNDRVELSNLQRQTLFDEADVGSYKATRAAEKLSAINSDISIEAFVQRVDEKNFSDLFASCDLIFDASDNFATRFLINKKALELGIPWVHTGVTASYGQSMLIIPFKTACFGCIIPEYVETESFPTVHNSGILITTVTALCSTSMTTALRYILSKEFDNFMIAQDVWENRFDKIQIERNLNCNHCKNRL